MDPVLAERPALNGELMNRVQQLRLDPQLSGKKGGVASVAWLPWLLCILMAFAWAGAGIRWSKSAPTTPAPADSNAAPSASPTTTATPAAAGTVALTLHGYLVPARQIAVSPIDVAGRVVELNVVEGRKYKAKDVLARIEDVSYRAMVEESKAALASAQMKLDGSKARLAMILPASVRPIEIQQIEEELKEATTQKERAQDEVTRLARLGLGTASEKELNQAKFDLIAAGARELKLKATLAILKDGPRKETKEAAEADIRGAEEEVKAAAARLVQAQWRLDNCIIRAPIDGTALTKKAELYNLVNPLAFAATSGSVCDLADLTDMEVEIEVGEREIARLAGVKKCRIVSDAYPDRVYNDCWLDRIMPVAERGKNIINVRVKLKLPEGEEPGTFLKPNMGATVTFLAEGK